MCQPQTLVVRIFGRGLLVSSVVVIGLGFIVEITSVLDCDFVSFLWLVGTIARFQNLLVDTHFVDGLV